MSLMLLSADFREGAGPFPMPDPARPPGMPSDPVQEPGDLPVPGPDLPPLPEDDPSRVPREEPYPVPDPVDDPQPDRHDPLNRLTDSGRNGARPS